MSQVMKTESYYEYIKGKSITDCAVADIGNIAFTLKEDRQDEDDTSPTEDRVTAILSYSPSRLQANHGFGHILWREGIDKAFVAYNSVSEGILYCDTIWNMFEGKNSPPDFQQVIPEEKQDDYTRLSLQMTHIAGEAYVTGHLRKVFKRVGIHQWVDLTDENEHANMFKDLKELKQSTGSYLNSDAGFSAIDGFADNDIYAGGRRGDLWHYDGSRWQIVDTPFNQDIKTITCGDDGNVYIAGYTGGIAKGRGSDWKIIDSMSGELFYSSAWFKGRLYLSGHNVTGLYILEGDEIKRYEFPEDGPKQYSFWGGVASSEDALVSYGEGQALVFDGEKWREIIGSRNLSHT